MLFQSFLFVLCFLPVVVIVHAVLLERAGRRAAQVWLLISSLFFYGYSKPSNLPLLIGSILFNWAVARIMSSETAQGRRKAILRVGLAGNVLFLCCFKYINFLFGALSVRVLPDWSLPLGISFFTLTQVMFLVDTYQGLNGPNSLLDHASLVCLFPYVTCGPLVRSRATVPQFHKWTLQESRSEAICRGLYIFAIGLVKKVVFADAFATIADAGYSSPHDLSTIEAWVATLAFTFQIYFDFSGYSDMALGAARMLGMEIPQNFDAPYRSTSISEFWQRWHISLSNFITSYLYTPLVRWLRSRGSASLQTRSVIATMLAMGITGLWHGPSWTFVVFGLLHGMGLSVNQVWKKKGFANIPSGLGWLLTFGLVNVANVFFRSPDIATALGVLGKMAPHGKVAGFATLETVLPLTVMLPLRPVIPGIVLALGFMSSLQLEKTFQPRAFTAMATAALVLLAFFFMNSVAAKQFIYFAF